MNKAARNLFEKDIDLTVKRREGKIVEKYCDEDGLINIAVNLPSNKGNFESKTLQYDPNSKVADQILWVSLQLGAPVLVTNPKRLRIHPKQASLLGYHIAG
jgi:hypothetical protein